MSSSSEAEADLVRQKKEHMKMRNFMKKQRMRERYDAEKTALQNQVDALRASVASLSSPGAAAARALLKQLRADCRSACELSQTMTLWVATMCNRSLPLPGTPFGWTETSLVADPTARKLGLDWYSQHLYHNTERMLACAQIPNAGSFVDTLFLEVGDGFSDLITRMQIEYDVPLHEAHTALRPHIWAILRGDTAPRFCELLDSELTSAIAPEQMVYRRSVYDEDESQYFVGREFASEDRIVFLLGTFTQDERLPHCRRSRPRLFWHILERTGPATSRLRVLLYNGPYQVLGHRQRMREFLKMAYAMETRDIEDDAIFPIYQDAVRKEIAPRLREGVASFRIESSTRVS